MDQELMWMDGLTSDEDWQVPHVKETGINPADKA